MGQVNPGTDPPVYTLELASPAGRILAAAHDVLWAAKLCDDYVEPKVITRTFLELIKRLMLRRPDNRNDIRESQLARGLFLRDYITRHLGHPNLDAKFLATELGMSRATFYRHFEKAGGVSHYIRNRRLDRCFFELAGKEPERGRIKKDR